MPDVSFAHALAARGVDQLTALLASRPDVLLEPAPRGFEQLAQRLSGAESITAALGTSNRDMVVVAQAVALLGRGAAVPAVAAVLRSPEPLVRAAVEQLCARGLGWRDGAGIVLPDRLSAHFAAELGAFRPVALMAQQTVVDDLRVAVAGLGADPAGLRKPELIARLAELMASPDVVSRAIAGLPPRAREHLDLLRVSSGYYTPSWTRRGDEALEVLVRAGLLLRVYGHPELPKEVAVSARFAERAVALTGPPALPDAEPARADAARSAAEAVLRGLTALLDEARTGGLAALKKGGVGSRERARLAKRVSATPVDVGLWIDLASEAGLLALAGVRYAPTATYDGWRESGPARQWAQLALAWFALDFAPTRRDVDDDTEVPPPVPLVSGAGMLRRALLRAAAGGRSVRAAAAEIEWFCPLHTYAGDRLPARVSAASDEAQRLGVIVGDGVSELGEHLLASADLAEGATDDLERRCAALLPQARALVVLQSDLTAMVSGQPSAAASRLLAAAAVAESHGVAATWRFTPASVRAALDVEWTPDGLRAELAAISDRPLPQPLDYLISDVARRHGSIRVRGMRACVVGPELEITEILHTRSLSKLHLAALAPTVLSSPFEIDEVLARLRDAGFAPLAEDADGVVIVEARPTLEAGPGRPADRPRSRVGAAELARRLHADPGDGAATDPGSATYGKLTELTSRLDSAELALLADALDNQRDVSIVYRDKTGNRTIRDIAPRELYGRWLDSWCYLKAGQREFTVANIEAVAPAE